MEPPVGFRVADAFGYSPLRRIHVTEAILLGDVCVTLTKRGFMTRDI
jgi:hypothetical protein